MTDPLITAPTTKEITAAKRVSGRSFCRLARTIASAAASVSRENVTDNYVSNIIHLAWVVPHQVGLILEGDPEATKLVKTSMLTRNVDHLERAPGTRAWAK
jgi:hypothetical protein